MDVRRPRDAVMREPFDPRDLEIARLKREVAVLRGREKSARTEAQDARKHFADLTSMSKRFAHSMRATVGERQQQRRRLAAQYAISQVLATARDLDEAAPRIYEILGECLGWHAGALWKVDYDSAPPVLRRAGFWRSQGAPSGALEEASEGMVFRRGEGLTGRVWERGEPVWVEDIREDGNIPQKAAAVEDGLRGALAFPIVDGRFVGVFELLRREVLAPDEDLMRTAALVGGQISHFLERRHAEEERDLALTREREARERASGILESINDAFFALDGERRFTYVNNRAERFWGKTREELLGKGIWEAFPESIGTEPHRAIERALQEGEAGEFEDISPVTGTWVSVRVYPSPGGVSVLFHSIEGRKRAEEALHRSRERLSAIFSRAAVGLCEVSLNGSFVMVNDKLCGILGRSREELLETSVPEITHPHNLPATLAGFERLVETGEPFSQDKRYLRPDGTAVWANSTLTRLEDEEGRPRGALAVVVDLMERKLAEEALRESEARLQRAMAIETVGVIFFKPEGDIFDANDAFLRMSGYDREDLEAGLARWDTMTPPEHVQRSLQAIAEFQSTGRTTPYEKEYVRKDGSRWWGLFAATRLNQGEGAEFIVDITETKRAEEALRASEERFRAIADLVPDLLWSNDATGATSWYNRRWFEYTGRSVGESEEYGWLYAVHPDDREASVRAFLDAVDNGQPLRLEHRIRGRDGRYRWFLVQARPLLDDEGRVVRWFGAATDIHEQRTALEALRESEERYRSLAEATSSIVWTGDKIGAVVEEMPGWEEFTGQSFEEYRGFGWLDALHPEDRPPEDLWEQISASDPMPMKEEYRLGCRDGEYRRIVLRGVPILDERGETREWVGTVSDVEERRRAEEEREELRREAERERARLETILRQMPGGVFVAEPSGRFVLANEGARRVYGQDVGSVEECGGLSRSYPDGGESPPEGWPLARALEGETVSGMEYYVVRPDGTRRIVRVNSAPVRDERGNVVAAVKAFEDVTRHEEAERERDRLREREREARGAAEEAEKRLAFYAGAREERQVISRELHDRVAHSIAVVRQNLELYEVLRDRNPEAAASKMELAKEEAKASLKSTRDLSMMLRRSEVEEGLTKALAGLEETTIPMGVFYGFAVTGDESLVPPHIGNQVFLVLREAVRNAVNHSGCEHVAVSLEITKERVIGTVEDDGWGFEPDGARAGGGLRSMEERAALVGGTFKLRSVPGGGTRIEVTVPLPGEGAR